MGFWREHMPPGMFLRSGPDWHLDPLDEQTLERFLGERRRPIRLPLPLDASSTTRSGSRREKGIEVRDETA